MIYWIFGLFEYLADRAADSMSGTTGNV